MGEVKLWCNLSQQDRTKRSRIYRIIIKMALCEWLWWAIRVVRRCSWAHRERAKEAKGNLRSQDSYKNLLGLWISMLRWKVQSRWSRCHRRVRNSFRVFSGDYSNCLTHMRDRMQYPWKKYQSWWNSGTTHTRSIRTCSSRLEHRTRGTTCRICSYGFLRLSKIQWRMTQ